MRSWHRRLWAAEGPDGWALRTLGGLLAPAEWLYRTAVGLRSWAYDRNLIRAAAVPIPTLGVGNLTVGGTGKTPVAAWFAGRLAAGGRRPAVVLRGYGGDEVRVHRILNPEVPVYPSADRVAGLAAARAAGCEVAVLDDVFQHRAVRVSRHVVLIAAEEWTDRPRMLPRGPWREPLTALQRAHLVVVTRKTADAGAAEAAAARLADRAPRLPRARAHIAIGGLARYDAVDQRLEPVSLASSTTVAVAVAGVAHPARFHRQLLDLGIEVEEFRAFPDHHRYDAREIDWIRRHGRRGPVVTTLKDAVKLGPALGPEIELRIGVQEVEWEVGESAVRRVLDDLTTAAAGA